MKKAIYFLFDLPTTGLKQKFEAPIKTNFVFCLVLIFTVPVTGQYQSIFGNFSTSWNIVMDIPDAVLTDSAYTTLDSSFNGYNYKTVKSWFNDGFIREDTLTGKAWFYSKEEGKEWLIMNLSLEVGDTFPLALFYFPLDTFTIVDSVYFQNGRKHIRFSYWLNVFSQSERLTFIEGIGPNAGIFFQSKAFMWNWGYNHILLCKNTDNVQEYTNTLFGGVCYFQRLTVRGADKPLVNIFPNPTQDVLYIEHIGKPLPGYEVELYHSNGSLLVSQKIEFPQQLDIRGLPSGIYLLKITSPDGQYSTYKIIKL